MYSIGLDLGIASVGWAVIDDESGKIIDLGVSLFSARNSENNLERRNARGARRLIRRRSTRLKDAQKLLSVIDSYTESQNKEVNPYELRVKGLTEQLTKGELYKVVTHIVKKRGISYLDEESEETAKESQEYKNEVLNNSKLLKMYTPGQIQLKRLIENGRVRTGINSFGEYQLNVFTVSAYARELEQILKQQQNYYPEISEKFIDQFIGKGNGQEAGLIYRKRPYYHGPGNEANHSQYGRWADFDKTGQPAENIFDKLIGKDIQGELRASASSLSAQIYNLLNDLNNLRLPRENPSVTSEEKKNILNYLMTEEITRFGANDLAKILGYSRKDIKGWRVDKNDRPEIHCLKVYRDWRNLFNNFNIELNSLPIKTIDTIAKVVTLNTELDGISNTLDLELPDLNKDVYHIICENYKEMRKKSSNSSWHSFSEKTLHQLIPIMKNEEKEQNTILEELKIKVNSRNKYADYSKIPIKEVLSEIYNPTVNKTVTRAFHILNALVERFGKDKLSYVTIEMPRDANEEEQKKTIKNIQKANENRKTASEKYFLEKSGWSTVKFESELRKKGFAAKLGYYYEQQARCAYSGARISVEDLTSGATEIDHIIPLSISLDDSLNNKVLVKAHANQEKGQRTPYQAFHDGAKLGQSWAEYQAWVSQTYKKKHKRNILLEERDIYNPEVREKFIARNLNDTRYASRVVLNAVQSFFNSTETKVQVVTGSFTHTLRKKWGDALEKSRETHHHHAVDAVLCAVAPFVTIDRFVYHAGEDGQKYMVDTNTGEKIPYHEYKELKPAERKTYLPKWDTFIAQLPPTLLYSKIKFNHQVDRKSNRKISDATIYSTRLLEKNTLKRGKEVITQETFILGKIKNIYTPEGWKTFNKNKENILAKTIDPKTYDLLCQIADDYPDYEEIEEKKGKIKRVERSPFERYCNDKQVPGIRKYSKKGNGPFIRSLKFYDKQLGNHINITRDEDGQQTDQTKNGKKVVLLSLNPWRTDVYYNSKNNKFELLGIKYNHLRYINGEYGVPDSIYKTLKTNENVSIDSEFRFSLYRKDGLIVENNEERLETLFHSRTTNNLNYFELKPINKAKWASNEVVPIFGKVSPGGQFVKSLKSNMHVTKFNTDHLGNRYYVKKEELKNIIPD